MNPEFKKDKTSVRETVRQAMRLHKDELIDMEVLHFIAMSALAWEITATFDEKSSRKSKKMEDRMFR